jgi:transcriptional regulator with XRE-family HTH domain
MDESEDPVMGRVRAWVEKASASGLTQHELGKRMGYSDDVARKAVWQFLRSKDPRIGMLRKFAAAADVPLDELINGPKQPGKREK